MAGRINELPKGSGIRWNSSWPLERAPKRKLAGKGDWVLAIDIAKGSPGLVAYYPAQEGAPEMKLDDGSIWGQSVVFRPFRRVTSSEEAEKFCVTFCSRGYSTAEALKHQRGTMWGFNWAVPTMGTVRMAAQIADRYFGGDYDGAWALGREFETLIREAENALYDRLRSNA